jgi:hypothetical protein
MSGVTPSIHDSRAFREAVNSEIDLAEYTADFQIILNLCKSLVTAAEQDTRNGKASLTFSTDLGLVAPLYYTAVKCPHRSLQEKALALLKKCPRKEGMWDSVLATKLVEEFWAMQDTQRSIRSLSPEPDALLPLNDVVTLYFFEGGRWEWVWRGTNLSTSATNFLDTYEQSPLSLDLTSVEGTPVSRPYNMLSTDGFERPRKFAHTPKEKSQKPRKRKI